MEEGHDIFSSIPRLSRLPPPCSPRLRSGPGGPQASDSAELVAGHQSLRKDVMTFSIEIPAALAPVFSTKILRII